MAAAALACGLCGLAAAASPHGAPERRALQPADRLAPAALAAARLERPDFCSCGGRYPNVVRVVADRGITAGLEDRLTDVYLEATIAATLCARLQYPRPCASLSHAQAHGEVSADVGWSSFVNVTVTDDGSSVFSPPSSSASDRVRLAEEQSMGIKGLYMLAMTYRLAGVPFEYEYGGDWISDFASLLPIGVGLATLCRSDGGFSGNLSMAPIDHGETAVTARDLTESAIAAYAALGSRTFANVPNASSAVIESNLTRAPDGGLLSGVDKGVRRILNILGTNSLVRVDAAPAVAAVAAATRALVGADGGASYVTLHIRRGDMTGFCDTSVAMVTRYVHCSLADVSDGLEPIVLFTDESDPQYLTALLQGLTAEFGGQRRVLHGDSAVDQVINATSPSLLISQQGSGARATFAFAVSLELRAGAKLDLRMDRTNCAQCDPPAVSQPSSSFSAAIITEQLGVTQAGNLASMAGLVFSNHIDPSWAVQSHDPSCPAGASSALDNQYSPVPTGCFGVESACRYGWALLHNTNDAWFHGWQSDCTAPCVTLGAPWACRESPAIFEVPTGTLVARAEHVAAGEVLATREALRGKVLRIRVPVFDGFYSRVMHVVVQASWATLEGVPYFVQAHVNATCGDLVGTCAHSVIPSPADCVSLDQCDAYEDKSAADGSGDGWESYFEPVGGVPATVASATIGEDRLIELNARASWTLMMSETDYIYPSSVAQALRARTRMAAKVAAWVKVRKDILEEREEQWRTFVLRQNETAASSSAKLPTVLGVHMRGTDKFIGRQIGPELYFPIIESFISARERRGESVIIFLATDDQGFANRTRERYGDRMTQQNSGNIERSSGHSAVWTSSSSSKALRKGKEVLLDSLLLAKCDYLLKSNSAVSEFAIYFNPELINKSYDFYITDQPIPVF